MRHDADEGEDLREAIDEDEEGLDDNDGVDHARQKSLCYDRMFFDELRQIIQSGSWDLLSGGSRGALRGIRDDDLPMARVRKPKPRTMPKYPTSGRIQKCAIT